MIKSVFAATAALSMSAGAALAGPYVNVEANASWAGDDYTGATTDFHIRLTKVLSEKPVLPTTFRVDQQSLLLMVQKTALAFLVKQALAFPYLMLLVSMVNSSAEDETFDDLGVGGKLGVKWNF